MQALVIDDSSAMRSIIRKILTGVGFAVSEAANGREGLERLGELPTVELVVVDWNMPEMDGLTFTRAVRADPRYRTLPLMMVTTETEMEQMGRALAAGVNEYVMKPFTREILVEKIYLLGVDVS